MKKLIINLSLAILFLLLYPLHLCVWTLSSLGIAIASVVGNIYVSTKRYIRDVKGILK